MTNIEISEHYIDSDSPVRIKFYPDSHRYQKEGEKTYLIGVTTATGMLDKSAQLMSWQGKVIRQYLLALLEAEQQICKEHVQYAIDLPNQKKEDAATIGTMAHEWAEHFILGDEIEAPEEEKVSGAVEAFLRWVNEYDVHFISSERKVYSKKYEYVGTMDCEFTIGKGENHKILHAGDFKTSSGIYLSHAFQVSAYQAAVEEEFGTKYGSKWILRFNKEDKFDKNGILIERAGVFEAKEFEACEHAGHLAGFLACLELKEQCKRWDKLHGFYSKM